MGGKQKLADQQHQANKLAAQSMRQQAQQNARARRVAARAARVDRQQSSRQNQALIKAQRQNAAALSALNQDDPANLRTEFIEDEEVARRRLLRMSGRNAYGFSRPSSTSLGGGSSQLG